MNQNTAKTDGKKEKQLYNLYIALFVLYTFIQ